MFSKLNEILEDIWNGIVDAMLNLRLLPVFVYWLVYVLLHIN